MDAVERRKAESYVIKIEQHFRAHFLQQGWTTLDDITSKAIEQYKVTRAAAKPAPKLTTLYKELVSLSRFLGWCVMAGHLDAVPPFERFKQRRLTIPPLNDKARAGRTIGLAPAAYRVLKDMAKGTHLPTSMIFGNRSFRRSLDLAVARAKVDRFTPHGLRHARLSEIGSRTRNTAALQYFAGHKNLSTTDRYVRSRTEQTELMLKELDSGKVRRKELDKGGTAKRRGAR